MISPTFFFFSKNCYTSTEKLPEWGFDRNCVKLRGWGNQFYGKLTFLLRCIFQSINTGCLSKNLGCLLLLASVFNNFHHTDPVHIFVRFILKYFIFFGAICKECLLEGGYRSRDLSVTDNMSAGPQARAWWCVCVCVCARALSPAERTVCLRGSEQAWEGVS